MIRWPERIVLVVVALILVVPFGGFVRSIHNDGRKTDTTWERVQQRGVLRVGMDYGTPPFAIPLPDGVRGYDVDLARDLATRLGVQAEIVNTPFDALHDALRIGKVDVLIAALPPTPAYGIAYSAPYVEMGERAVVLAGAPIRTLTDLAGKRVGAELGSDGDLAAREFARRVPVRLNSTYDSGDDALAALRIGKVDVVILDGIAARRAIAADPTLALLAAPIQPNGYVIATGTDAPMLTARLNTALNDARAAGVLRTLDTRWLTAAANESP